jgi:hypothetical protein
MLCIYCKSIEKPTTRFELATLCLRNRCNNHYATLAWLFNRRFVLRVHKREREKKKKKTLENPGFDPGASSLLTTRSSDWASPPNMLLQYKKCIVFSDSRFRSSDLWVMSPTRFRCAKSLCILHTSAWFWTCEDKKKSKKSKTNWSRQGSNLRPWAY